MPTPFDLEAARQDARDALASHLDRDRLNDETVDEALRQALDELLLMLPAVEASVTVTTTGRTQSLAALTDLYRLVEVSVPWDAEVGFDACARRARLVSLAPVTLFIEGYEPAAGDVIRVRYWARYQIAGLDGAASTTFPILYRSALGQLAAGKAIRLSLRRLSEEGRIDPEQTPVLLHLAGELARNAAHVADLLHGVRLGLPNWGGLLD